MAGKYEDGEGRFWATISEQRKPFGEDTIGIVDENAGGIVAYVGSFEFANQLVDLLKTTE
ncbi:MAG: hypothetical protein ACTSRW_17085 [Candidatus Helarchaeota archaeon]